MNTSSNLPTEPVTLDSIRQAIATMPPRPVRIEASIEFEARLRQMSCVFTREIRLFGIPIVKPQRVTCRGTAWVVYNDGQIKMLDLRTEDERAADMRAVEEIEEMFLTMDAQRVAPEGEQGQC